MKKPMNLTKQEYKDLTGAVSPKTHKLKNSLLAFLFGGIICTAGEGLYKLFEMTGLREDQVKMAVPVTLITLGALLTGLKIYNRLAKYGGAGTLVPITGFANAIVAPAMEFKSEGHIMGIGAKMFAIAGPVLVFGIASSVIYGIILCLVEVLT